MTSLFDMRLFGNVIVRSFSCIKHFLSWLYFFAMFLRVQVVFFKEYNYNYLFYVIFALLSVFIIVNKVSGNYFGKVRLFPESLCKYPRGSEGCI